MSWTTEVSSIIKGWLSERSSRNVRLLERRTDISYSTIRRMIKGEQETSFESAVPVLSVIMSPQDLTNLVKKHFGQFDYLWRSIEENTAVFVADTSEIEWHAIDIPILALAGTSEGVSKSKLNFEFGRLADERVNYLVANGLLRVVDDRILAMSEEWRDPSPKSMAKQAAIRANSYDVNKIGDFGTIGTITLEASDDSISNAVKVLRSAYQEVYNLVKNSEGEKSKIFVLDILSSYMEKDQDDGK